MIPLKQTPYWQLMADAAAFLSSHLPAENSEEYLQTICMDANALAAKWEGQEVMWLMNGMLHEILQELCRAGGLVDTPELKNTPPAKQPPSDQPDPKLQ